MTPKKNELELAALARGFQLEGIILNIHYLAQEFTETQVHNLIQELHQTEKMEIDKYRETFSFEVHVLVKR